ncbi:unnamed protein product, partial [Ectocarpus sp. 12 AP-2014]
MNAAEAVEAPRSLSSGERRWNKSGVPRDELGEGAMALSTPAGQQEGPEEPVSGAREKESRGHGGSGGYGRGG